LSEEGGIGLAHRLVASLSLNTLFNGILYLFGSQKPFLIIWPETIDRYFYQPFIARVLPKLGSWGRYVTPITLALGIQFFLGVLVVWWLAKTVKWIIGITVGIAVTLAILLAFGVLTVPPILK
jgi:hypothetical protein